MATKGDRITTSQTPDPHGPFLAYEMPDGPLKLLDGHLRRDLDMEVEVLDVTDGRPGHCCIVSTCWGGVERGWEAFCDRWNVVWRHVSNVPPRRLFWDLARFDAPSFGTLKTCRHDLRRRLFAGQRLSQLQATPTASLNYARASERYRCGPRVLATTWV